MISRKKYCSVLRHWNTNPQHQSWETPLVLFIVIFNLRSLLCLFIEGPLASLLCTHVQVLHCDNYISTYCKSIQWGYDESSIFNFLTLYCSQFGLYIEEYYGYYAMFPMISIFSNFIILWFGIYIYVKTKHTMSFLSRLVVIEYYSIIQHAFFIS